MKRSEIKRKTPLKQGEKPLKRSAFKSGDKPMARKAMTKKPSQRKVDYEDALDTLTPELLRRSQGLCEVRWPGICTGHGEHRHHRKLGRGKGTQDSVEALLYVCTACHQRLHLFRKTAEAQGYIVKNSQDPSEIPVVRLRKLT